MNKCIKCGYNGYSMDLHHEDSKKKEYKMAYLKHLKITSKRVLELNKCIPLCANCHGELHVDYSKDKYKIKWRNEWNKILKVRGQDICSKCGYNGYSIDLHHRNTKEKYYSIGVLKCKKFKLEYLKELDKCDSLCKVCHRELEAGEREKQTTPL